MAWIRSHQELARNPKTKRLSRLLGVSLPQAIGHLHLLWWWAMDFAPDGDLSSFDAEELADAAGWEGDAGDFIAALINARGPSGHGFLEENMNIHEWYEHAGRLIEQRVRNAERMRQTRATHVQRTCNARAGAREDKIREDKKGGDIHDTCIDIPSIEDFHNGSTPPPPQPTKISVAGWEPTAETRNAVDELLRRLEGVLGAWPFSQAQIGNGTASNAKEELAAILRLLSVDEVVDIVRRRLEERTRETKGADRPRNLLWYLPAIKDAFYARDRKMEEAERRRDEEKKARARASPDEPASIAGIIEEVAQEADLTDEERERIKQRIREVREKIAAGGAGRS